MDTYVWSYCQLMTFKIKLVDFWSCNVTKKGRAHRNPTALSALPTPGPRTARPLTVRSHIHWYSPKPQTLDHRLPICWSECNSTDPTRLYWTQHTHLSRSPLTQTHHKNSCISFTICTYSESSGSFLQHKTTKSDRSGVLVSFLHRLFSCSTNLATYQTQRKIQDIAEAQSYKSPSFSSKSSPHLKTQSTHLSILFLLCPLPISSLCVFYFLSTKPIVLQQTSYLPLQKVRCFFQKLLQNAQF